MTGPCATTARQSSATAAHGACLHAHAALERADLLAAHRAIATATLARPHHPALPELRARVALLERRPDVAVTFLAADELALSHRRLLLNIARCQAGELDAAALDLADFCRQADCPAEAVALLACLDAERGDLRAARVLLEGFTAARGPHRLTAQLAVLIDHAGEPTAAARQAMSHLAHAYPRDDSAHRMVSSLELGASPMAPLPLIERLAGELIANLHVLPALVAAYRLDPAPHRVELLRRTLHRIVDDTPEPLTVLQALAELSEIAGDNDDARRWALRGLRLDAYSARLALLLDRIAAPQDDDVRTLEALRRASAANPQYSDVRRALILRYHRAGMTRLAAQHADKWVLQQPEQPLAHRTHRELAA